MVAAVPDVLQRCIKERETFWKPASQLSEVARWTLSNVVQKTVMTQCTLITTSLWKVVDMRTLPSTLPWCLKISRLSQTLSCGRLCWYFQQSALSSWCRWSGTRGLRVTLRSGASATGWCPTISAQSWSSVGPEMLSSYWRGTVNLHESTFPI